MFSMQQGFGVLGGGTGGLDWTALEGVVPLGNITGVASLSLATDGGRRAFTGTLTGNVTLSVSNVPTGLVTVVALLTQDATGGRAVTMPPNTTLLGGSTGSINTTANSSSIITLITRDSGATWLAAISDARPTQHEPLYINPLANGAIHVVMDFPVTLNLAGVRQRGTGTLAYDRSTDGTTFSTVTGSTSFAANDVLRVTVTGYAGYLTLVIPRTA